MAHEITSGMLYFNKTESSFIEKSQVRGKGNQHDENRNADIKGNEEFIKNGIDNYFPFDMEATVKRSMLQKRAFRTITNIVNGKLIFQNEDLSAITPERQKQLLEIYKLANITKQGLITPLVNSNYLQGGSFATMQWASNGRALALENVTSRQFKTGRLSFPTWNKVKYTHPKHYFHRNWGYKEERRNKKVKVSKDTISWLKWNEDSEENFDAACYVPEYNIELSRSSPVNRLQSYLIGDFDGLSDYYPKPIWFSGTTYNYTRAEFFLSCFDIDDIENGLHASGVVKVYHSSYVNPESDEAHQTFEDHKRLVEEKLSRSYNSGSYMVVPCAIEDGKMVSTNDTMEFEPLKTNSTKDRHETFDKRIMNKILGANGVINPELVGIRDEKSTLSESGDKLINDVKLLIQFTIKPQQALIERFLNDIINPELGIEENVVLMPNVGGFINLSPEISKHFLHPDQWYTMMQDFGLAPPTAEQILSGLIPAYSPAQKTNF
jgi:hypothetical protein